MSSSGPADPVIGFKRHLRAEICQGLGAFLFSERGVTALRGARVESVAALLDGTADLAAVLESRPAGLERDQVAGLIDRLMAAGLVTQRAPAELHSDERAVAFWDAVGVAADADGPGSALVGLFEVGGGGCELPVRQALENAGLSVAASGTVDPVAGSDMSVVVCDDYLEPALADVEAAHRAAGIPWLLAKTVGTQVWTGPMFGSPGTGCWHCLAHRLWGHREAEACVQRLLGRSGPAGRVTTSIPALAAVAVNLVSLEVSKWLAGHRYAGQGSVWTLDSADLAGQRHQLRPRPQCPHCGEPELMARQADEPIVLRPTRIAGGGGGQRAQTADEVLDRLRHLISPVTGVVKEVTRDRRGPSFLNAYVSGPNPGVRANGLGSLGRLVRQHSGGKGITALDAQVGALCEAIERFSGTFQGDEKRVPGSLRSLGERAIDPRESMLYDPRQHAHRQQWNAAHAVFQHVPQPFDDDAEIDWTPVWSLTAKQHRLLPTAMLYYGYTGPGTDMLCADSNGNAAGSSMADAVLQGLLELVERDAVALWWYNRLTVAGVDLDAFDEPWLSDMRRKYTELGRELWVLDLTADLGVPVMAAVSRRVGGGRENVAFGFGAHLDPHIALRRAITEQNQLMPAMLGDDVAPMGDPDADHWFRLATLANQPYLVPDPAATPRTPRSYGYREITDISAAVAKLSAMLAERGLQTFVLDQTRPDIALPVVKVVVPGLRHYWARYAPGRLFDVPVELGLLAEPTRFDELNPIPMFM